MSNSTVSGGVSGVSASWNSAYEIANCEFTGLSGTVFSGGYSNDVNSSWIHDNTGNIATLDGMSDVSRNLNLTDCVLANNSGGINGGATNVRLALDRCLYASNGGIYMVGGRTIVQNSTISHTSGIALDVVFPYFTWNGELTILNSIIAYSVSNGIKVYYDDQATWELDIQCSEIFGNASGDVIGIDDPTGTNGNISANPMFCAGDSATYELHFTSPCAEANSACGQIGVRGVGCYDPVVLGFGIDDPGAPDNVVNHNPLFNWSSDTSLGFTQTAFEIAVGTDDDWTHAEMWNPAPFQNADTVVQYNGAALVDGETYYARLRLSNGSAWSEWYNTSFRMNSPPTIPVTLHPINDEVTGNPPTLWLANSADAEEDALFYDFHGIRDTSCARQDPIEAYGIPEAEDSTGYTVEELLDENCHYWWQARAYDGYEYSEWTELFPNGFRVDGTPEPPTPPTPIYPPDTSGLPIFDMTPEFTWTPSYDPDPYDTVRYKLEVALDPTFMFVFSIDSIPDPRFTLVDSLEFGTQYWWRVTAFDKTGLSTPSEYDQSFWTWTLGDLDHSHSVDIADLVYLVSYMFQGGPAPYPLHVADINGDCVGPDISDLIYLVTYMFNGGPPPVVCSRH